MNEPTTHQNQKQETLKQISKELKEYDYANFNVLTDKQNLAQMLQSINSRLGSLIKGFK